MAVVAYGHDTTQGGMTGEYTHAGVADETWRSWDSHTQDLWLQDYFRTEEQATYYQDSPQATAFEYVSAVDTLYEPVAEKTAQIYDDVIEPVGQGLLLGGALVLGILLVK